MNSRIKKHFDQVITSIRQFFSSRGFHEVIIPILHTSLPLEPNIYAFKMGKYYLPTSPEATLKKAIAKGAGNCFAIGHTFRDLEGSSPIHKPEFLMLEWYREEADYKEIMEECRELTGFITLSLRAPQGRSNLTVSARINREIPLRQLADRNDKGYKWPTISMEDLFRKYTKLNLEEIINDQKMEKAAKDKGYETKDKTWEQIFNQIFLNEIVKHLPQEPFFLIDYPARISPLCARREDKPYLAQRFELYINGIEIANGNTENTDANEVLKSMKEEEKYRKKANLICPPIDMEFIKALKKMQGKSYAGIGLGIDRLIMILGDIDDIKKSHPGV